MGDRVICAHCGASVNSTYAESFGGVKLCGPCAHTRHVDDLAWRKIHRDPLVPPEVAGYGEGWGVAEELADEPIHAAAAFDIKEHVANEAKRIVSGARRANYGTPENNFERIARFWTAYFANTGRDVAVTAADVSPMMRLMKEARLCETPDHLDSHVDLVGYTLTGAEVNGVKP